MRLIDNLLATCSEELNIDSNLQIFIINFRSLTSLAILVDLSPVLAQRPQMGSSGSRGSLLEQLRYYARDAEGLASRALSPIQVYFHSFSNIYLFFFLLDGAML